MDAGGATVVTASAAKDAGGATEAAAATDNGGATEVTADLFCAADVKHQTEIQLLAWLKQKAIAEYEKKGFTIMSFEVLSLQLDASSEPDKSVQAFFHGQYGRVKDNDGIRAKVKLQLLPVPLQKHSSHLKKHTASESKPETKSSGGDKKHASKDKVDVSAWLSDSAYEPAGFLTGADQLEEIYSGPLETDVARLFQSCYADGCGFEIEYHSARGDTEVLVGKWDKDPKFGSVRNSTYVVKLSGPIGPPTSRVEETQRYNLQPDKLVVETLVTMLDAPYADHFRVESQMTFSATGASGCSAVARAKPIFSKSTMLESTITKKTLSGMTKSAKQWMGIAKERCGGSGGAGGETAAEKVAPNDAAVSRSFWKANSTIILVSVNVLVCVIAILVFVFRK
jgi:hypothetical protein